MRVRAISVISAAAAVSTTAAYRNAQEIRFPANGVETTDKSL
jgi:hypothetical protein